MKHVACYCRVSTEEQAKYGFSIQAQKEALEKYCKENKYKYEFFIDEGISASSMKKRKALNNMLNRVDSFDTILFTKLDRLSRNVLDANNINKILNENNCTMKAIDEDDVDTSTADGTFIFNLKVSLAQREIGKTSERIKFVFQNKRNNGEVTSGTKKYGYDIVDRKFVVNEEEANNILELYNYFISKNGCIKDVYAYFIEHFKGKSYDCLYSYLRDTAYIGKYKLYKKNVYLENYIPRIIDDDLFYTVQTFLKKGQRKTSKMRVPSLFVGILRCNSCGSRMCRHQDNRTKVPRMRYSCDSASRKKPGSLEYKCLNKKSIREEYIESYLLNNINQLAENYITQNNFLNTNTPKDNHSEINKIEKKLQKLKELYLEDLIDKNMYKNDYQKLNNDLIELKSKMVENKKSNITNLKKILNMDINNLYITLSFEEKRNFWLSIIDTIYIENGEIKEVTFL